MGKTQTRSLKSQLKAILKGMFGTVVCDTRYAESRCGELPIPSLFE